MAEECLICKAPLEYLEEDVMMQCALCQKKELSKARCVKGHYVCDECHSKGVDDQYYDDVFPVTADCREYLNTMVLGAYEDSNTKPARAKSKR